MRGEDQSNVQGVPVRRAGERVKFGGRELDVLLLALASITTVPMALLNLSEGLGWSSVLMGLSVLVVVWGWWAWFAGRRGGGVRVGLGFLVYVLAFTLRVAAGLLGSVLDGAVLNPFSLFMLVLGVCASVYFWWVLRPRQP